MFESTAVRLVFANNVSNSNCKFEMSAGEKKNIFQSEYNDNIVF